jgi:hypothetical protein
VGSLCLGEKGNKGGSSLGRKVLPDEPLLTPQRNIIYLWFINFPLDWFYLIIG